MSCHRASWLVITCSIGVAACGDKPASPDSGSVGLDASIDGDANSPDSTISDCVAPGSLDMSFALGGVVEPVFGLVTGVAVGANAVVIDPMQRILVAGSFQQGSRSCVMARFLPNGARDPSFGTNGISRTGVGEHLCWHNDLALQADGKIVAVGAIDGHTDVRTMLMRYLPNGSLDPTFGDAGVVIPDPTTITTAMAVAIDSEQRIVVAEQGFTGWDVDDRGYFLTRRYLSDGSIDVSFGIDGIAEDAFNNGRDASFDLAVRPDGTIVVVGTTAAFEPVGTSMAMVRYTSEGLRDPSFGTMGLVTVGFADDSSAAGLAIDSQGRGVVAGTMDTSGAMARVISDGALELSFGASGKLVESGKPNLGYSAAAVSNLDETILAVGSSSSGTASTVELVRYRANGSIDASFGSTGFAQALPLAGSHQSGSDVAVQADGRIVVVGNYGDVAMVDMLVARYCP